MITYVYKITSPSGKAYIGITKDVKRRWKDHQQGRYTVSHAIRKYGDKMRYEVLCLCEDWDYACHLEVGLIKSMNTKSPNGYNLTDGGDGTSGFEPSDATKAKQSKAKMGTKHTLEHRANNAKARVGKKYTLEHCANIAKGKTGINRTPEHCSNIAKSKTKVTPEIHAQIIELRKTKTFKSIVGIMGLSRETISRWSKKELK